MGYYIWKDEYLLDLESTEVDAGILYWHWQNVAAVDWLALLLRIWEVPCLNFGLEIGYLDWGFPGFPPIPTGTCWDSTLT
jgi:hypothetical protein